MKQMNIELNNIIDLKRVVDYIFKQEWQFLYLNGDLGAGKTTLTKLIAKELGIKENVVSPTFNKMKIYDNLVHIDAYNLKGDLESFEDYFEDKKVIIEWSNNLVLDYKNVLCVDIKFDENGNRNYKIWKEN